MREKFKKFLELVSKDEAMKQKALAINGMAKEDAIPAMIALAKEVGIELTEADFPEKEANNELSDDELVAVAGGNCFCSIGGAGSGTDSEDGKTYGCACIMYGQGGDGRASDMNCRCVGAGGGKDDGV